MPKAYIYTRFSPRPNAADCDSCEHQDDDCRGYAKLQSLKVAGVWADEAVSGKQSKNRPHLATAIRECCDSKGVFIVRDLSRLARSVIDAVTIEETLRKAGCSLVCIKEGFDTRTSAGRMMFGVVAVIAQFERELISERTSAAMLKNQANGRRQGGRDLPFGTIPDPNDPTRMVNCPEEQATIERIVHHRSMGAGLREIGRILETEGLMCRGRKWQHTTVKAILKRAEAV